MRPLKLSQLEVFLTVVEAGSFSAAAVELGCTQSRISHAIAELEQTLGHRLLERSRSGCALTGMGNRVLPKARQMLSVADQLREIAQGKSELTANFRLACFRSVGTYVLPTIFEVLGVDYPGIRVDVDDSADGFTAAIIQSVREGRADIGIARRTEVSDLTRLPYIHDIYCAAVPESLTVATPVRWDQLASLPYIQPHNVDGASTIEACRAAGFPAEPARRMTNDIAILAMVSRGAGVTILPRLAAYPVPQGAKIASLPIVLKRELALYLRPEVARTRAMRTLCRYLRDKALVRQAECFRAGDVGFDY